MTFDQECPFCGKTVSVPAEMTGQTAQCPNCNQEIYLEEPSPKSPAADERRADEIRTARAAMIAAMPTTMPKVTMAWAFDFVLKITVAAVVIDGLLSLVLWFIVRVIIASS